MRNKQHRKFTGKRLVKLAQEIEHFSRQLCALEPNGGEGVSMGLHLKPPSGITDWRYWPNDVRETVRAWNRSRRLSFGLRKSRSHGAVNGVAYFKCSRCEEFCRHQMYGTCEFDGKPYCDDCMIALAREGLA